MDKRLLKIRENVKNKKPDFIRQDAHKKAKLTRKWRNPRGVDSKIRLNKRGYRVGPSKGYKSPQEVRHALPSGMKPVMISNLSDLSKINKAEEAGIIYSQVGLRKRIEILKEAEKKGIIIANIKDPKKYVEEALEAMNKRKEEKKKMHSEKEKKKEATKEKGKTLEKTLETEEDEKTKKDKEKKELDKMLSQKQH